MPASSEPVSSPARRYRATVLGVALVIVGLCLVFVFPNDRLPWQAKGYTQPAPDCGATSDTIVCVQPPSQVAETGVQFTVDIVVDRATNLGAYEFTLSFDPSLASLVGVTNGTFLGSTGRSVNCLGPFLGAGSVRFGCVTLGDEPGGPSGTGLLARLKFSGLAPGTSALDLTRVVLTDISGMSLSHSDQDGDVVIVVGPTPTPCPGGVCPTATPTPVPTATSTPAGGSRVVRIDPDFQSVLKGSTVTVSVAVDAAADLGAYQFTLAFDPAVLEFVSVSNGPFLGSTGRPVFCPPPTVGANTVQFACVTTGSAPDGPSGSGVLSVLEFLATGPGTSTMDLFDVALANPRGTDIPTAVQDGTVAVTLAPTPTPTPCPGGICPTPTITPTRTVTPTPTATPLPVGCAPEPGTTVCVQPPDATVAPGNRFDVDMVVDEVGNLGSYEFTLAFDPTVVALTSVNNGPFLGSTGRTLNCADPIPGAGSVRLVCTTLGAAPPGPSGSGVLATVGFFALTEGSTQLQLQEVILTDITGSPITAGSQNGAVTVSSGPTPTPLPTTTPSSTPTAGPSPTPGGTLTRVEPDSQTVSIGDSFSVNIRIDNVANLGSYEWLLNFDPALVEFVSVINGPFLGSTGRTVFCPGAILDTGSVRFGCSTTGATPPGPTGSGVLSTVTFSALAEGTSPLDLVWVQLSDPLAGDIPTAIHDGGVTVVPVATPTATATTVPTTAPPSSDSTAGTQEIEPSPSDSSDLSLVPRLLGGLTVAIGASVAWRGRPRARDR
jgi:hypothetical protein